MNPLIWNLTVIDIELSKLQYNPDLFVLLNKQNKWINASSLHSMLFLITLSVFLFSCGVIDVSAFLRPAAGVQTCTSFWSELAAWRSMRCRISSKDDRGVSYFPGHPSNPLSCRPDTRRYQIHIVILYSPQKLALPAPVWCCGCCKTVWRLCWWQPESMIPNTLSTKPNISSQGHEHAFKQ